MRTASPSWIPQWLEILPLFQAAQGAFPGAPALDRSAQRPLNLAGLAGTIAFQNIYRLTDGAHCGQEALIRPTLDGHPLTPLELFALGTTPARLQQLDRWALQQIAHNLAAGPPLQGFLSINLRTLTFTDPAWLHAYLDHLAFPRHRVVLEILETDTVPPPWSTWRDLQANYPQTTFAIDDWGAGLPDLSRLLQFSPGWIKCDRLWVQLSSRFSAITPFLRVWIPWAHDQGIQVLIEGIETAPQRDWAAATGFDAAQGYLWGRPAALLPI